MEKLYAYVDDSADNLLARENGAKIPEDIQKKIDEYFPEFEKYVNTLLQKEKAL